MKLAAFFAVLLALPLEAATIADLIIIRDFGDLAGRTEVQHIPFTGPNIDVPVNYTTGGATPAILNAVAGVQGSPFRGIASNHVSTTVDEALTFMGSPSQFASVSSVAFRISDVVITGSSGIAYLLPVLRIQGTFQDTHPSAIGTVSAAAGISGFSIPTVASSSTASLVDVNYSPLIGAFTQFTFGTPFELSFAMNVNVLSNVLGTLAPGEVSGNFTLQLAGLQVVDGNGNPIPNVQINSDFLEIAAPEPATLTMMLLAAIGALALRRR